MTSQCNPPRRSHRDTRLPQRLRDPDNIGEHDEYTLNIIAAAVAHHRDIQATTISLQILSPSILSSSMANSFAGSQPQPTPPAPSSPILIPFEESDSDAKEKQTSSPTSSTSTSSEDESEEEIEDKVPIKTTKRKKPQKKTRARKQLQKTANTQQDPVDQDGFLKDIDVQSIAQEKPTVHFRQKTHDTDHFFGPQVGTQQRRHCKVNGCISDFVPEATTLLGLGFSLCCKLFGNPKAECPKVFYKLLGILPCFFDLCYVGQTAYMLSHLYRAQCIA
ncbi:hypothetical protein QCA50_019781 [Cerrena zonata]|uniref:Uncharacterized protein n=1 Tax=Cerrena zonata TaxID=2478898 RepID=A0AAW0F8M5_9APHY